MRTGTAAASATAAGLLLLASVAGGTALAQPGPDVVGMSETQAIDTLDRDGVPWRIINRAGSTMTDCVVTEQRDLGYDVQVDYEWDDDEWKKVETEVWRGVGLTIFCR